MFEIEGVNWEVRLVESINRYSPVIVFTDDAGKVLGVNDTILQAGFPSFSEYDAVPIASYVKFLDKVREAFEYPVYASVVSVGPGRVFYKEKEGDYRSRIPSIKLDRRDFYMAIFEGCHHSASAIRSRLSIEELKANESSGLGYKDREYRVAATREVAWVMVFAILLSTSVLGLLYDIVVLPVMGIAVSAFFIMMTNSFLEKKYGEFNYK